MGPRTTAILLALALLLGAFIYLYEIRGEADREAGAAAERLLFGDVDPTAIDRVVLTTSDGVTAEVARSGPGWHLVSPVDFAGDDVALEAMASALTQLEVEGRVEVPDPPARPEDFGFGEGGRELRFEAGGEERVLRIGSATPVGSNTYVEVVSAPGVDPGIVFVATWRTNALRKSLDELRDRRVLHFDHSTIDRLSVEWGKDGGVALEKRDDGWWLTGENETRADGGTVETLLSDLAFLRADGFVDAPASDRELGLEPPKLRVVLGGQSEDAGDFELTLSLGSDAAGEWVARASTGHVYRIGEHRVDDIPRNRVAYRFKELARFEVADARSFELVYADAKGADGLPLRVEGELVEAGWRTRPLELDASKVRTLIGELARLKGNDILADALGEAERAAIGLSPPRLAIRVWGEDALPLADVALGKVQAGRGIVAQRAGVPVVYRVDETLQERIPLSDGALRSRFLAPAESGEGSGEAAAMADEGEAGDTPEPAPPTL